MNGKLTQLRERLIAAQRSLIITAADSGSLPPDSAIRKIADMELAIGAIENLIEETRGKSRK